MTKTTTKTTATPAAKKTQTIVLCGERLRLDQFDAIVLTALRNCARDEFGGTSVSKWQVARFLYMRVTGSVVDKVEASLDRLVKAKAARTVDDTSYSWYAPSFWANGRRCRVAF